MIELLSRQVQAIQQVRENFLFINGLPTAEVSMAAYSAVGYTRYSSAVFAFAPALSQAFFRAFRDGDEATQRRLLREFFLPFAELRSRRADYPVSLVKAAAEMSGTPAGSPRPPLARPDAATLRDLHDLLEGEDDRLGTHA